ncbi:MAG: hypothetical protein AAFV25_20145 [Bacteroidota bacterium]
MAVLSKTQQLSIDGGRRDCAYYNGVTGEVSSHLTPAMAQGALTNASDHWCCNSCASASWANQICTDPDWDQYNHICLD